MNGRTTAVLASVALLTLGGGVVAVAAGGSAVLLENPPTTVDMFPGEVRGDTSVVLDAEPPP